MLYEHRLIPSSAGYELPLDIYCAEVTEEIDAQVQRPAVVICPGCGYHFLSRRES